MGSQQNKLENLEMVLFDFDDTLCIHSHRSDSLTKSWIIVNCSNTLPFQKFLTNYVHFC